MLITPALPPLLFMKELYEIIKMSLDEGYVQYIIASIVQQMHIQNKANNGRSGTHVDQV